LANFRPGDTAAQLATILLADNDELSRDVFKKTLVRAGYEVLDAASGVEALRIAHNYGGPLSLLVTEISMPGMDGLTLASRLQAERPETNVLYVTAFVEDDMVPKLHASMHILRKPFLPAELTGEVRQLLPSREPHAAGFSRS
jgi:CheY-like chemotaxis protein